MKQRVQRAPQKRRKRARPTARSPGGSKNRI